MYRMVSTESQKCGGKPAVPFIRLLPLLFRLLLYKETEGPLNQKFISV